MPIDLHRNDQLYNMVAEGEVANILAHYNSDYIMHIIKENIKNRFNFNSSINSPNLVDSYEINFKDLMNQYPSDVDNIKQARDETYQEIISIICQSYNLQYIPQDTNDYYKIAFHLYDVFVSGYTRNIVTFFSRYIYQNKEAIYNNLELFKYKKERDSSTVYIKRMYNDIMIATIISKIKEVIYYISGFDIDMYTFLTYIYDRITCDYINSIIIPTGNIFKENFCSILEMPVILTEIRLNIQQLMQTDINMQQQLVNNNEEEQL